MAIRRNSDEIFKIGPNYVGNFKISNGYKRSYSHSATVKWFVGIYRQIPTNVTIIFFSGSSQIFVRTFRQYVVCRNLISLFRRHSDDILTKCCFLVSLECHQKAVRRCLSEFLSEYALFSCSGEGQLETFEVLVIDI